MATTQNEHNGNGTQRQFSFTFPYIKEDDVKVSVRTSNDDVTTLASTAYTFPSATEILLTALSGAATTFQETTGAPKTGVTLRVFRETDIDNPKAVFFPGSSVRAQDLNDNTLQALYAEQERQNRAVDRIGGSVMQANLTMQQSDIIFEGDTIDAFETTLTVVDPTTDRTITLPDVTGTVVTTGDTNTVTGTMIAEDTVGPANLAHTAVTPGTYTTADITVDAQGRITAASSGTVAAPEIENDSVGPDQLADTAVVAGSYTATDLTVDAQGRITAASNGVISRAEIANDAIDGTKIDDAVIDSEHYADGSIDNQHIADHTIQYGKLQEISTDHRLLGRDNNTDADVAEVQVATDMIADDQVTYAKMQNVVTANRVLGSTSADGIISEVQVATDMVVDDAITDAKLADSTTDNADRAVGTNHIKDSAVTSDKILDGTIVNADINASAAIAGSKISMEVGQLSNVTLTNLADNQILKYDAANNVWQNEADGGSGGSTSTDLSQVRTDTTVQVVSSTGNNVTIPAADSTDSSSTGAGIMSKDQATRVARSILDAAPALHGNLDVNGNEITSASDGNVVINPDGNGLVELGANLDLKGNEIVSSDNATIVIQPSGNGDVVINQDGTSTCHFQVNSNTNSPSIFSNGSTGRVGIGTNAPVEILDVLGNVRIKDGNNLILQNNAEDHTISINADDVTDSYNLTLPPAHGTANQVLRINAVDNNDNVELEWGTIDVSSSPRLEHLNTTDGFTIAADSNAAMVGPLTINSGQTITVGNANSVFKIL